MTTKWRIYCTEPGDVGWQETWSDTIITECPNNAAHSVNTDSVQVVEESVEILRIPIHDSAKTTSYSRLSKFQYSPETNGIIRRATAVSYKDGNMTSFDVQIFDATNNNELVVSNLSNTVEETIQVVGTLSNVPTTGNVLLEVSVKRNGGNGNSKAYIDEIVFYS